MNEFRHGGLGFSTKCLHLKSRSRSRYSHFSKHACSRILVESMHLDAGYFPRSTCKISWPWRAEWKQQCGFASLQTQPEYTQHQVCFQADEKTGRLNDNTVKYISEGGHPFSSVSSTIIWPLYQFGSSRYARQRSLIFQLKYVDFSSLVRLHAAWDRHANTQYATTDTV